MVADPALAANALAIQPTRQTIGEGDAPGIPAADGTPPKSE
tara:strand:+ start:1662 stop:1784 length:123 start_codon:yes stop_codon:yes gene_type:complete